MSRERMFFYSAQKDVVLNQYRSAIRIVDGEKSFMLICREQPVETLAEAVAAIEGQNIISLCWDAERMCETFYQNRKAAEVLRSPPRRIGPQVWTEPKFVYQIGPKKPSP